jgi:predicted nucleotidyltransferase
MIETEIFQKRSEYTQALDSALATILASLREMPKVIRVILFGSYAAGRRDLFTDLNLLVVMDTGKNVLDRTTEIYQKLHAGVDLDLLVYTPEEFERNRESHFIHNVLTTGKMVYEKKLS